MNRSTRADLWFLFIVILWGTSFPLVKGALEFVSPALFVVMRFLIAGPIWFFLYRHTLKDMKPGTLWRGILLGAVLGLGFVFQTAGLRLTTASMSAFITGLNVMVVPLLVVGIERRLPRLPSLIGVALCAVGLYVMTAPSGQSLNPGDLLTIGCAVMFGLYIVLVEVFTVEHDPRPIALIQTIGVLLVAIPAIPLIEIPRVTLEAAFVWRWLALGTMAALTLGLQLHWQRYITATRAAIIFALEPVFAAVFSYFMLRELLPVAAYLGGGLIVLGMVVAETGARILPGAAETPAGNQG